jgi:hypothetical protein
MPATIPCPNPNCGQMFAAETIQGTGKLACPRCGTVFQFRPATPATPTAQPTVAIPRLATPAQQATPVQIPVAQPVRPVTTPPPVPTATPVVPARVPPPLPTSTVTTVPTATPTLEDDDEEEDDRRYRRERTPDPRLAFEETPAEDEEPGGLVRRRRPRRANWGKWLWLGPIVLTCISTTVVLTYLYIRTLHEDALQAEATVQGLENATFVVPERPWNRLKDDVDRAKVIKGKMGVNYVACRSDPSNNFALYNRDYQTRMPAEGELLDLTLQKLRNYFTDIEWEKKEEGGKWAGQNTVLRLDFQAVDANRVFSNGEVWVITAQGVAYLFFSWCPEPQRETASAEWEGLRGKFTLGTKRAGWKETPPKMETINVPDTPYQIRYPEDMWEVRREEGWDPMAKVVLGAYEREGNKKPLTDPRLQYAAKLAVCQVLRLPKADGLPAAVEAARTYVLAQQKMEAEDATFQEVLDKKGKKEEGPADVGVLKGYVTRQQLLTDSGSYKWFVLLAVVSDNEGVLVFQFKCRLDRREYWESEFAPIWQSLRRAKK